MATAGEPAAPAAAAAVQPAAEGAALQRLAVSYARYLAAGRSDGDIHLWPGGAAALARVSLPPGGVARCDVTGLQRATPAVLVHEVTHCLVAPHIAQLQSGRSDAAGRAADRLLRLASEGISDARALIEVFRADGADAALLLHEHLQTFRLRPASPAHDTGAALRAAWLRTRDAPQTLAGAEQALAAALDIGAAAAPVSLRRQLTAEGRPELADAPEVQQMQRALRTALAQVSETFLSGRRPNASFTWHAVAGEVSTADRQVVVVGDGFELRPTTVAGGAPASTGVLAQAGAR